MGNLFKVTLCMLFGIALGAKLVPQRLQKANGILQYILIAVLIFSMGAGLGSSPTFFEDLGRVGLQAVVFSALPILFSVLGVYFATKHVLKEKDNDSTGGR